MNQEGSVTVKFRYDVSDIRRGGQEVQREFGNVRQSAERTGVTIQKNFVVPAHISQNLNRINQLMKTMDASQAAASFKKVEAASDSLAKVIRQNLKAEEGATEQMAKQVARIRADLAGEVARIEGLSVSQQKRLVDQLVQQSITGAHQRVRAEEEAGQAAFRAAKNSLDQQIAYSRRQADEQLKISENLAKQKAAAEQKAQQERQQRSQALSSGANTLGGTLVGAGTAATAALTAPIILGFREATKAAADLEAKVANISTIKPIDNQKLFRQLNELSTRVPQEAEKLGDSLYNIFSSIDVSVEDGLKLLELFAKGATAALTDADTFGTAILGVMNAYKMSVNDAAHISDVFFNTVNRGVVSGAELANSLGVVTQSAKQAGVSFDELGALIVGATKEGGPAAQNINNLANFLNKVVSSDSRKDIKKIFDVDFIDKATGKFKPMIDFLSEIKVKYDQLDDASKSAALQKIFPDAQARQGAAVLLSQLDSVKEALKANQEQTGATEAAYLKMSVTWNAQSQLLANVVKYAFAEIGSAILPIIQPLIMWLAKEIPVAVDAVVNAFKNLSPAMQTAVMVFAGIVAAIGPLLALLGAAIIAVAGLVAAFTTIAPVAGTLALIFGGVLTVLAGLAAGVAAAIAVAYELAEAWDNGFGVIASIVAVGAGAILAALAPVLGIPVLIAAMLATAYKIWQTNFAGLRDVAVAVWNGIVDVTSKALSEISRMFTDIGGHAIAWWRENYPLIKEIATKVNDAVEGAIKSFLATVQSLWGQYGEYITSAVKTTWNFVYSTIITLMDQIGDDIRLVLQLINGDWQGAWDTFLKIIERATQYCVQLFLWLQTQSAKIFLAIVYLIGKYAAQAAWAMQNAVAAGIIWVVKAIANLPDTIIRMQSAFIAAGASIGRAIWNGIKNALAGYAASTADGSANIPLPDDIASGASTIVAKVSGGGNSPGGPSKHFDNLEKGAGGKSRKEKLNDEQKLVKELTDSIAKLNLEVAALERGGGKIFDLEIQKDKLEAAKNVLTDILKLRRELEVNENKSLPATKAAREAEVRDLQRLKSAREELVKISEEQRDADAKLAVSQRAATLPVVDAQTRANTMYFDGVRRRKDAEEQLTADLINEYRKRADFEANIGREKTRIETEVYRDKLQEQGKIREDFLKAVAERSFASGNLTNEQIQRALDGSQTPVSTNPIVQKLDDSNKLLTQIVENTGGKSSARNSSESASGGANKNWDWRSLKAFGEKQGFIFAHGTDGIHNDGSRHYRGLAVDLVAKDGFRDVDAYVKQLAVAIQNGIRVVDERIRPKPGVKWKGAHAHFEENDTAPSFFNPKLNYNGKLEYLRDLDRQRLTGKFAANTPINLGPGDGAAAAPFSDTVFGQFVTPEVAAAINSALAGNSVTGQDSGKVNGALRGVFQTYFGANAKDFLGKDNKIAYSDAELKAVTAQIKPEGDFKTDKDVERAAIEIAKNRLGFLKEEQATRASLALDRKVEIDQVLQIDSAETNLNNYREAAADQYKTKFASTNQFVLEAVQDAKVQRTTAESATLRELIQLRQQDAENYTRSEGFKTAVLDKAEAARRKAAQSLAEENIVLQDKITRVGEDSADRYRNAWLKAIYDVRDADTKAVESQIASQVKLADNSVLHTEQVRASVLGHLAEQKSASQGLADGINSVYDSLASKLDGAIDRTTKKLGFVGQLFGDYAKAAGRNLLSGVTKNLLDAFLPGASKTLDQQEIQNNPVAKQVARSNELLEQIAENTSGGAGGSSFSGTATGGGGISIGGRRISLPGLPGIFGGASSNGGSSRGGILGKILSVFGLGGGKSGAAFGGGVFTENGSFSGNPLEYLLRGAGVGGYSGGGILSGGGASASGGGSILEAVLSHGSAGLGHSSVFDSIGQTTGADPGGGIAGSTLGKAPTGILGQIFGGGNVSFGSIGKGLASAAPLIGLSLGASLGQNSKVGTILGGAGGLLGGLALGVGTGVLGGAGTALGGIVGALGGTLAATGIFAAVAAPLLIGAFILSRNAQRKKEEKLRTQFKTDAVSSLDKLISALQKDQISGADALSQGDAIKQNYLAQASQLKDKKTRNIAISDVGDINTRLDIIRREANSALGRQNLDTKIRPEFATGGVIPGKIGARQDVVAHGGEIVANLDQQAKLGRILMGLAGVPGLETSLPGISPNSAAQNGGGSGGEIVINMYPVFNATVDAAGITVEGLKSNEGKRQQMRNNYEMEADRS